MTAPGPIEPGQPTATTASGAAVDAKTATTASDAAVDAEPGYVSHADIGGRPTRDPVVPEPEGDPFHARWEARAMALTLAMGATGQWNIDMSRAARETLPDYAALSYFQIWLAALERLLEARGLVTADETAAGHSARPPLPIARTLQADDVARVLARGSPTERPATRPARFAVGDRVCTRADRADHHTRLPGYARGRIGTVERVLGMHVYADAHAHGLGEDPQWLYTVVFPASDLWPGEGRSDATVSIDAWEPYLEAA
jgi:nitrile hydratase